MHEIDTALDGQVDYLFCATSRSRICGSRQKSQLSDEHIKITLLSLNR